MSNIDTTNPPAFFEVAEPSWLETPDALIDPERVTLWGCLGESLPTPRRRFWQKKVFVDPPERWLVIFHSSELAETYASLKNVYWKWNGEPANPVSLKDCLLEARQRGRAGVEVMGFRNGEWIMVREFRSDVPLGCGE